MKLKDNLCKPVSVKDVENNNEKSQDLKYLITFLRSLDLQTKN